MVEQPSNPAVASLASLRTAIHGLQLWGPSLADDAERIRRNLSACGLPRPDEYALALSDAPIDPSLAANDWSIILQEVRDDLRNWWESWQEANDALDAAQELVNRPGSHPVDCWSFRLRRHLNDLATWLEPTRPFPFGRSECKRHDAKVRRLSMFVQAVKDSQLPNGWIDGLARLDDADHYLWVLQNDLGIRPGRKTDTQPAADGVESGSEAGADLTTLADLVGLISWAQFPFRFEVRSDPRAEFDRQVRALMEGGRDRAESIRSVAVRWPALHIAYLWQSNNRSAG